MRALIDGDVVAYRAAFIGQNEGWLEDEATDSAKWLVEDWCKSAGCDTAIVCLSPPTTFRHAMSPLYKAHRKGRAKPSWLSEIREELQSAFDFACWDDVEADDVMGILQSSDPENSVTVTVDKDLMQVAGNHYNPVKKTAFKVSEEDGYRLFLTQWLTGDSTDGYRGIPGVGPKNAERLLGDPDLDPVRVVLNAYKAAELSYEYCLLQANLAMILQSENWDEENRQYRLWIPPEYD